MVAVGKYFRQYDHPDDAEDAQFSSVCLARCAKNFDRLQFLVFQVHEMYIPRQYKAHIQHYFGDVGIIVTTTIFDISASVQPICIMWESKRHQALADPSRQKYAYVIFQVYVSYGDSNRGFLQVSGWGYTTEYRNLSDVLRYIKVPLITDDDCNRDLTQDLIEYLTDDKLCAGFLNSSNNNNSLES